MRLTTIVLPPHVAAYCHHHKAPSLSTAITSPLWNNDHTNVLQLRCHCTLNPSWLLLQERPITVPATCEGRGREAGVRGNTLYNLNAGPSHSLPSRVTIIAPTCPCPLRRMKQGGREYNGKMPLSLNSSPTLFL